MQTQKKELLFLEFLFVFSCKRKSALGELEALSCARLTGFLPFFFASVAGQHTAGLEDGLACFLIMFDESARDSVTDSAGLTGFSAAGDGGVDIDFSCETGHDEGLENETAESFRIEIFFKLFSVDGYLLI